MSLLIAFEGPDGVGKSTQCRMLTETLTNAGYKSVYFSWPCDGVFGSEIIRAMLVNGSAKSHPNTFQILFSINKLLFQNHVLPKIKDFDVIILDRWALSTHVYSKATGVNPIVRILASKFLKKTDMTFVFLGESFERKLKDSYESDGLLQRAVRNEYEKLCDLKKDIIKITVNNCAPFIHSLVLIDVMERLT